MLFLDSLGVKTKDMFKNQGVLLLLLFVVQGAQSCHIALDSSVIPIGSPLSASCDCPHLGNGKYEVIWKLDGDFIQCNLTSDAQTSTCPAYIASFNKTSGLLQCYVSSSEGLQLVDQITINAGYPPAPPTNISCLMNISQNIVNCTWQLQKHSLLEENVTLSTFKSSNKCSTHLSSEYICNPSKGDNFCTISRTYFNNFGELSVEVTVQNKIGSATSSRLCVVPLQEVKLDPIVIKDTIPHKDCVTLQWTYGRRAEFLKDMRCQLNYRKATEMEWTGPVEVPVDVKTIDQCGLVGSVTYDFQIRCIRKNLTGQWSEWGPTTKVTTVETIPTGKLETWWRILEPTHDSPEKIQLLWKPLERNKANAEHLWYIVKSSLDLHETDTVLCNTTRLNCTISLPTEKNNVFIWAYNNAGASPESEITFTARNGTPVSKIQVSSNGDSSLKVMWEPQSSAKSYLLEWHKNTELSDCEIHWRVEQKGKRSSILQGIQPYQRYSVKLYPLYEDCIGMAIEMEAYSKEGVPDFSPDITLITVNKSQAAVQWKPIPVQRSNGFINYTVYWTDTNGREHSATLAGSATKYNITNLLPSTTYQVLLSSSTSGGSVNGTGLMLHTAAADNEDIDMMLLIFILLGFFFIIAMVITCIMKQERMKDRFWPVVPDPANSQMGKRALFLEKTPEMTFDITDVSQIVTCELRIVEGWKEKNIPLENEVKDKCFEDYGLACNTQTSSSSEDPNRSKYYINVDTVQYAKVITEGYREQSPPTSVYVRSDSTQPLLCDGSPSPQNYENAWFHFNSHEDSVFLMEEENMKDFPLLKALQLHED